MKNLIKITMYNMTVALIFIAGIVFIAIGLIATQENTYEPVNKSTIDFAIFGDSEQRRIVSETVKYFENENNCDVQINCFPNIDSLQKKVLSKYSVGDPFDVFYIDDKNLRRLNSKLAPLDDILIEIRNEGDQFIEKALLSGMVSKSQYALPTGVKPYCMFYNKKKLTETQILSPQDLIDSKKWDLKNFELLCKKIFIKTNNPALAISPELQYLYGFIIGNGGKIIGFDRGKLHLDEKGIKAITTLKSLIDLGAIMVWNKLQWGPNSLSLFKSESVPMVVGPIDYIYELHNSVDFEWDIIPIPMISNDYTSTVIDIPKIAVSKGEKERIAKKFVKYFVSSFGQKIRLQEGERLFSSLNMAFYTSFGGVSFPNHSNYLFFMSENGQTQPINDFYVDNVNMILEKYKQFISGELQFADFIYMQPAN